MIGQRGCRTIGLEIGQVVELGVGLVYLSQSREGRGGVVSIPEFAHGAQNHPREVDLRLLRNCLLVGLLDLLLLESEQNESKTSGE